MLTKIKHLKKVEDYKANIETALEDLWDIVDEMQAEIDAITTKVRIEINKIKKKL